MAKTLLFGMLITVILAGTAEASTIELSFDALVQDEDVLGFYSGNYGSLGSGPGPDYGITFSTGAIVGGPDAYGNPSGYSAQFQTQVIMDLDMDFTGSFSLYYQGGSGSVDFYSDSGGTGILVYSLDLFPFGQFEAVGSPVPLFRSAVFVTPQGYIDSITLGEMVIPECSSLFLLFSGLSALGLVVYRRKKK